MAKNLMDLPVNVLQLINNCSKEIGKYEDDYFNIDMFNECQEKGLESPLEQLLYIALKAIIKLNHYQEADPFYIGNNTYMEGVGVFPQTKIGKYRCDFQVSYYWLSHKDTDQHSREIIVECDSQQFHERTEQERRYEKERDRYLTKQGIKVFHYTGAEIVKTPLKIAKEIVAYVVDTDIDNLQEDSNID